MKNKEYSIDSVKLMRDIRDKMTDKYLLNPEQEIIDLEKIHKKYHLVDKLKNEILVSS
jgi:hypothetical protein